MSSSSPAAQPVVLSDVIPGESVRDVLLTVGYTAAMALGAQLSFFLPGNPVPITGTTFVVLAGAIVLGAKRASAGALLFAGLGVAGVPLFAASNGATLGYIVGYLAASALLGAWASRGGARSVRSVTTAMVVGNLVIYALGLAWAAIVLNVVDASFFALFPGLEQATFGTLMTYFVAPFLLGDAIKIALAVAVVPTLWKLVGRDR